MTAKRQAHKNVNVASWMFGHPVLRADNNSTAKWKIRTDSPYYQKGGGWLAELYGGIQTNDDWAAVYIPVNELPVHMFDAAHWSYYMTAAEVYGVNIVIWVHDAEDFDKRAEITQAPSHADLAKAAGWNAHKWNVDTTQMFYFGENVPGTTQLASNTQYKWSQFQEDPLFKDWLIYRVSIEFGWYSTGTFDTAYVAEVKLNEVPIPLVPPADSESIGAAITDTAESLFGEPTLTSAQNGDAVWSRASATNTIAAYQKGSTGWLANLFGGLQTGGKSFGALYIPVDEMRLPDLQDALWTYYFTAAEAHGVNMVIWAHDPNDNDRRVEITQAPSHADLERAIAWNAHELSLTATQFFYFGEIVGTPDTTPTAGTQYTLAQFQSDSVFSAYTIYRISLEYGWYSTGTFDDAWLADIRINNERIPLKPDSAGSGRIGHRKLEQLTGAISFTLSPKTPYRLLTLSAHTDNIPVDGEAFTSTVSSTIADGTDAGHFANVIQSEDMFDASATSLFVTFGEGFDFSDTENIVFAQANGDADDWGIIVTYQTVYA